MSDHMPLVQVTFEHSSEASKPLVVRGKIRDGNANVAFEIWWHFNAHEAHNWAMSIGHPSRDTHDWERGRPIATVVADLSNRLHRDFGVPQDVSERVAEFIRLHVKMVEESFGSIF